MTAQERAVAEQRRAARLAADIARATGRPAPWATKGPNR